MATKHRKFAAIRRDLEKARAAASKAHRAGRGAKRLVKARDALLVELRAHPEHPGNVPMSPDELVRKAGERWADENLGGSGSGSTLYSSDGDAAWDRGCAAELRSWTSHARKVLARVRKAGDPLTLNSMERHFAAQR